MKIFIIICVVILFVGALALATCAIVDRVLVGRKIKAIKSGMTGYQVQEATETKLKFISMSGEYYYAKMVSPLHFFKYELTFKNGRLKEIAKVSK